MITVAQSFVSHFRNHLPRGIRFYYHGRPVKPSKWPALYHRASRPGGKLVLDLYLSSPPRPPRPELLAPPGTVVPEPSTAASESTRADKAPATDKPSTTDGLAPSLQGQHTRPSLLLPKSPGRARSGSKPEMEPACGIFGYLESFAQDQGAAKYFAALEDHICSKTTDADSAAYKSAPEAFPSAVYEALRSEKQSLDSGAPSSSRKSYIEKRASVFNSANVLFQFFFPQDTWVATTKRFWGAVMTLVTVRGPGHQTDGFC